MKNHIFNDSKTYVDLQLKKPPNETLKLFDEFMVTVNNQPSQDELTKWIYENFDESGSELERHKPLDHKENIEIYNRISDKNFKKFAKDLNNLWVELCRKMKDEVKVSLWNILKHFSSVWLQEHPELSSIIYVENPFIIAGGRFREFYYWDSFWIIRGLLATEMYQTARGILENFLSVIDRYGLLPNGGRVYYLARSQVYFLHLIFFTEKKLPFVCRFSQPPLLPAMIKSYVDATHDFNFAISSIETLEREFEYFMATKMVTVKGHRLARYIDHSSGPRPESYREDVENAKDFATEEEKQNFYSECKAAGESGMDFSSRW